MGFLAEFAALVFEWLLQKLGLDVWNWVATLRSQAAIRAQAKADASQIQNAKTPQEQSNALQKTISDTFGNPKP